MSQRVSSWQPTSTPAAFSPRVPRTSPSLTYAGQYYGVPPIMLASFALQDSAAMRAQQAGMAKQDSCKLLRATATHLRALRESDITSGADVQVLGTSTTTSSVVQRWSEALRGSR